MTSSALKRAVINQQREDLAALNRLAILRDDRKESWLLAFERYLDITEAMREIREGQRNAQEALREIERLGL